MFAIAAAGGIGSNSQRSCAVCVCVLVCVRACVCVRARVCACVRVLMPRMALDADENSFAAAVSKAIRAAEESYHAYLDDQYAGVRERVHVHARMRVRASVRVCVRVRVCVHVFMYVLVCARVHLCVCASAPARGRMPVGVTQSARARGGPRPKRASHAAPLLDMGMRLAYLCKHVPVAGNRAAAVLLELMARLGAIWCLCVKEIEGGSR